MLVKQESIGLSKKKRRKSIHISDHEPLIKKVKTEPEDSDDFAEQIKKQNSEISKESTDNISGNLSNISFSPNSISNKNVSTKNKTSSKSKKNVKKQNKSSTLTSNSQNSSLQEEVTVVKNIKQEEKTSESEEENVPNSVISKKEVNIKHASTGKDNATKSKVKKDNSFKPVLKKKQNIDGLQNSTSIMNKNDESDSPEENVLVPTPKMIRTENRRCNKVQYAIDKEKNKGKQKTLNNGNHSGKLIVIS